MSHLTTHSRVIEPCQLFLEAFGLEVPGTGPRESPQRVIRPSVRPPSPRITSGSRPLGEPSIDLITALNNLSRVAPTTLTVNGKIYGIDLVKRGHEVKKLLHAGFGMYMTRKGYDPDDVLQEVYKGIIARNHGRCPWDGDKSSFGHYVHMVCACVLSNYARKARRREQFERIGMRNRDGEEVDAGDLAVEVMGGNRMAHEALQDMALWVRGDVRSPEASLKILPLAAQGYDRAEIISITGMPEETVNRGLRELRQSLRRKVT